MSVRIILENGKNSSKQAAFFSSNHIDFDFNRYSFIPSSFFNVFKRKKINFLNLKKNIRNKKICAGGTLFLFLIFFIAKHPLFYVWIHSKLALIKECRLKSKSMWFGKRRLLAGGFFTISSGYVWSSGTAVRLTGQCDSGKGEISKNKLNWFLIFQASKTIVFRQTPYFVLLLRKFSTFPGFVIFSMKMSSLRFCQQY